jgi:rSAM/selenodomain-associated transferase 1
MVSLPSNASGNPTLPPTAVVIMAKVPEAGAVKTRLCPPLSPQEAAALYQAFLLDKIAQVRTLKAAVPVIAYTPCTGCRFFSELAADFILLPQQGADLGERLANSLAQLLAEGYSGALAIDSDTPTLPTAYLQQAIDLIATPRTDVVLGPSEDGGYYLIGLNQVHRELFENIAWSTDAVMPQTVQRAAAKGLHIARLPSWFDVDTPPDLDRLRATLVQMTDKAPRYTRQFFLERIS